MKERIVYLKSRLNSRVFLSVGNLLYRLLGYLALNPQCQDRIHEEAAQALEHWNSISQEQEETVRLRHRSLMVYTEAAIMEALRLASSPIVPHVAIQNATIGGQCFSTSKLS